ncbi:septal ring lytic transglycosylase RlpA family protein [Xylophilus sp. Kf1]|nr:septal ring lytic transglycosylase RlpA family protein [Xylophilus sp. Kf1]
MVALATVAALLAGCAGPKGGGGGSGGGGVTARAGRDGADAVPPANLAQVPDAEPRTETIRSGGPNKPYAVLGRSYTPMDAAASYRDSGLASWYGRKFHGASTSSGEPYDMYAMTAAHPTLPIPSYARVRNPANGREVIVRVNDRGPFHDGRIIDLSYTAAFKLDLLRGVAPVEVERITPMQIASGQWRRGNTPPPEPGVFAQAAPVPPPAPVVPVPAAAVAMTVYTPPAPTAAATAPSAEALPADLVAVPLNIRQRSADQDQAEPPPPLRSVVVTTLPALAPLTPTPTQPTPATGTGGPTAEAAVPGSGAVFWVQLGAFGRPEGAAALQRRATGTTASADTVITVLQDGTLNRVQAGPFASRDAARDAAQRLGDSLQLAPVVVERR